MVRPATIKEIQTAFLENAERISDKVTEGFNVSLSLIPEEISMNRFTYALFVMVPYWLSLKDDGEPSISLLRRHGAFITYKTQVEDDLDASFILAMLGQYSAAHTLLRSSLELLCRGAFYDGLAKQDLREKCRLLGNKTRNKIDGEYRSIQGLFDDLQKHNPKIYDEFEMNSGAVLDKLSVFMGIEKYRSMFPSFRKIVQQLTIWGHFEPIQAPIDVIYSGGYRLLSLPVHGNIDSLDVGRRLIEEESLFALPSVDEKQLRLYMNHLDQLLDIGLVLTFNLMTQHSETLEIDSTIDLLSSMPLFSEVRAPYFHLLLDTFNSRLKNDEVSKTTN